LRRGSRRHALEDGSSRGDEGLTLVELLVAIAVIVIVLVPTTVFVVQAQTTVSSEHLRAEAVNVATRELETLQLQASEGTLPTGTSSTIYPVGETGSRVTDFDVTTSWTVVTQGTNQSICASGASIAQQIWLVTAVVTWPRMHGAQPVVQTTEISPAQAGAVQQFAGELAVRITYDGTDLLTGQDVQASVTGTWTGSAGTQPAIPTGTVTSETQDSGSNGCIVFENLDATSDAQGGYNYTLSFAGNEGPPPLVSGSEYADTNPNGPLTVSIPSSQLQPGVPDEVNVTLNVGTDITLAYTHPGGSCTTAPTLPVSPPVSSSIMPVSVYNSLITAYSNNTWVAYPSNGTTPFSSVLLFPWSGVTDIYPGDQPDSSPSAYGSYTSPPSPCVVDTVSGNSATVYMPVYPLTIVVNSGSASTLTAKEVAGGSYPFSLNETSPNHFSTSMPLGEYLLSHDTTGTVSPAYVWVTPAGECTAVTITTLPPAQAACNSASVNVSAL
jgi:hypothetical protein